MSLKLDRKIIKYAITGWIPASFMTSQNEIRKEMRLIIDLTDHVEQFIFWKKEKEKENQEVDGKNG